MGTLRFFEEVVSFKIRRTFGFADYIEKFQFISVIVPSGKHPAAALSCGMFFIKIGAS